MTASPTLLEPTLATPGSGPVSAAGDTLVIASGPTLGRRTCTSTTLTMKPGTFWRDASAFDSSAARWTPPAGSTVFVPAGLAHTYKVMEPSRYLIFLTPRLDRLIARLRSLEDRSQVRSALAEFDTEMVE